MFNYGQKHNLVIKKEKISYVAPAVRTETAKIRGQRKAKLMLISDIPDMQH